ncbi:MAG: hypothetical protein P8X70_00155 [Nanoarchaeota archaeon]
MNNEIGSSNGVLMITDEEIKSLIEEKKILKSELKPTFREGRSSQKFEKEIEGENGNKFKIVIRISNFNPSDFSIILCTKIAGKWFRLMRCNGDSHEHTNKLEEEKISGYHIHYATGRYQENGYREENYAKSTNKFSDWKKALVVMLQEANFQLAVPEGQRRLS